MIFVLDNFFYDPRPKVPIFPKESVCRNFYTELLRWPSRYRDYFCCEQPKDASIACGCSDWKKRRNHMWDLAGCKQSEVRNLCHSIREVLEMKGMSYMGQMRRSFRKSFRKRHPGEPMPLAPLRAISYASAGGSFSAFVGDQPASALMKVGYKQGSWNVYTNKVVLLDEVHNLVRSETRFEEQLRRLQGFLLGAENIVLAGFTGTPILDKPDEGRQLLDIIKGRGASEVDEGFLSSFPARPRPLFPESLPRGIPDGVLTTKRIRDLVRRVELSGEALRSYDVKRRLGYSGQRLRNYCNLSVWVGSFHEGRSGSKARVLSRPIDCCPKLWAVAKAVAESPKKAVVLTGRTSGYVAMVALLQQVAAMKGKFGVATMDELAEFNHVDNLHGKNFRVLVADSMQCSEGVNFFAVRRIFLTDVPSSPSQLVQQVGRAIRLYGHSALPEKEQTVTSYLYVASLPHWMRAPLTFWASSAQKLPSSGKDMERIARRLASQLKRAGLGDMASLKSAIDRHAGRKAVLGCRDVVSFLEDHGLWEETRGLQDLQKKEASAGLDGTQQIDDALNVVHAALTDVSLAAAPRPGKRKNWSAALQGRLKELSKSSLASAALAEVAPSLNAALDGVPLPSDAQSHQAAVSSLQALRGELEKQKAQRMSSSAAEANPLVQALNALRSGDAASATARPETADELALRQLSDRSREFAPALAALRAPAVDREFFAHYAEKLDELSEEEAEDGAASDEPLEADVDAEPVMETAAEPDVEPPEPHIDPAEAPSTVPCSSSAGRRLRRKTPPPLEEPRARSAKRHRFSLVLKRPSRFPGGH